LLEPELRLGRSARIHLGAPEEDALSKKIHMKVIRELKRTSVFNLTAGG
jgi:hypothetical protein